MLYRVTTKNTVTDNVDISDKRIKYDRSTRIYTFNGEPIIKAESMDRITACSEPKYLVMFLNENTSQVVEDPSKNLYVDSDGIIKFSGKEIKSITRIDK